MLEALVTTILNRLLGSYVENFDPAQLNIGLLSGDVRLNDLTLKRAALDKLHLPLNVVDGHIGSLVLQIPYSNFKTKPVKVLIEDVFMLASPDLSGKDDADSRRRDLMEKIDQLALWELSEHSKEEARKQEKGMPPHQSYFGGLVTKIIDNLQVSVKNIHIRYEDWECVPKHPFAMGLTLAELSAVSTNSNWEPKFITDVTPVTYKLATLDTFAFYWDTDATPILSGDAPKEEIHARFKRQITASDASEQFIIRPVNGQGYITSNKLPPSENTPKIHANLQFEEFAIGLDRGQYRDMLSLADCFDLYFKTREYRKLRPSKPPKEDPAGWFKYAAQTVLHNVQDRRRQWSWPYIKQRLADMNEYVALYKKKCISGALDGKDKEKFDELQEKYSFDDLILFRVIGKKELKSDPRAVQATKKSAHPATSSWTSWIWGGRTSAADASTTDDDSTEITDQEKQELYEALELDKDVLGADASSNQVILKVDVSLHSGSIRLSRDPRVSSSSVGSMSLNGVHSSFVKRPESFLFTLGLDSFNISDLTQESQFPDIVKVHARSEHRPGSPFFWVVFEQHPLNTVADSSLTLKSRSIAIVHNAKFLEEIIEFFTPPKGKNATMVNIINAANQTVEGLREQTIAGLEYALEEHKTIVLKLDIEAPLIFIPLDPQDANSPVTIIDAGSITVNTDLVGQDVLEQVKSKQTSKYNAADWKRLESLMYDKFNIGLHDTQFIIGNDFATAVKKLGEPSSALHVLDKTTLDFKLEVSIMPQNASLPRCRLSISLPELNMGLADVQYRLLLQIIDAAVPTVHPRESELHEEQIHKPLVSGTAHVSAHEEEEKGIRKASDNPSQRMFELKLVVQRARAVFSRDWEAIPVVQVCLHQVSFDLWKQQDKLGLSLNVGNLMIDDLLNTAIPSELRKVAESQGHRAESGDTDDTRTSEDLLSLEYSRSESAVMVSQTIDLHIAAIKFVLTPETLLTVYDYILSTFTNPDSTKQTATETAPERAHEAGVSDLLDVSITLNGITILFNDYDLVIARAVLASAKLKVNIADATTKFQCVIGELSLVDELNSGSSVDSTMRQLVSIEGGSDLVDFRYEMLDPNESTDYNCLVYARSGSLKLSILEEPLSRLLQLFAKLTQMKEVYDQARMVSFGQAIQIEHPEKVKLDIILSSPIIVFPRMGDTCEILTFNLGELFIQNEFVPIKGVSKVSANHITAGIRKIALASGVVAQDGVKNPLEMIKDTDLIFRLLYTPEFEGMKQPLMNVKSKLSPTVIRVTKYQYNALLQLSDTISNILGGIGGLKESERGALKQDLVDQKHLDAQQVEKWDEQTPDVAEKEHSVANKLAFEFEASSFVLNLYTCDTASGSLSDLERLSLSSFVLGGTTISLNIDASGSITADVVVKSFTVEDTRRSKENKFPKIVPPAGHDEYQLMVHARKHANEIPSLTVSLDGLQLIFALDYFVALQAFFLVPKSLEDGPTAVQTIETTDNGPEDFSSDSKLAGRKSFGKPLSETQNRPERKSLFGVNFNFSVVDMFLTILAEPNKPNSEAIVFKIEHIVVDVAQGASLSLSKIGMFLTCMDSPTDHRLRLLQDFDITLSAEGLKSSAQCKLTKVKAEVQSLVLRLSLHEILLAISICDKASKLLHAHVGEAAAAGKSAQLTSSEFSSDGHRPIKTSNKPSTKIAKQRVDRPHAQFVEPVVIGESLQAQFGGLHFVLIEPVHQIPMLECHVGAFQLNARNWSSIFSLDASTQIICNVFSFSKSAWEPVVDKLDLGLRISQASHQDKAAIDIFSRKITNIEITSASVSVIQDIRDYFNQGSGQLDELTIPGNEEIGFPYRIKNDTEFTLCIWSDCADSPGKNTSVLHLKPGEEAKWYFYDWRVIREDILSTTQEVSLAIDLENSHFKILKNVSVNLVGEHLYYLASDTKHAGKRLACEIYLEDHIKHIVLRSTVVVSNSTDVPLEVRLISNTEEADFDERIVSLLAGDTYALPISAVESEIYIRPDPKLGFNWCTDSISWTKLRNGNVPVECVGQDGAMFYMRAATYYPQDIPLKTHYPYVTIVLSAPLELINNLPYDLTYRLYCKDNKKDWTHTITKGESSKIYVVREKSLLLLSVKIEDTDYERSEFAVIATKDRSFDREEWLHLHNKEGHKLKLRLGYIDFADGKGSAIVVMAPYIILNHTGRQVTVGTRMNHVTCNVTPVQRDQKYFNQAKPTLWSFDSPGANNKAIIKVDDSHWSNPVSFTATGQATEVTVSSHNRKNDYHMGFNLSEGERRYHYTRVVELSPRFVFLNKMSRAIQYREPGGLEAIGTLQPGDYTPIGFISNLSGREMCLSFADGDTTWSSAFVMSNVGITYVRMKERGKPTVLAKVDTILTGATLIIHLGDPGPNWPYSVRNLTDLDFVFHQSNPFIDEDGIERKNFTPVKYHLPPRSVMSYSWDFPAAQLKELVLESGGKRRRIQLAEIGELPPAKFPNPDGGRPIATELNVVADGSTQALIISPFDQEESNYDFVALHRSKTGSSSSSQALDPDAVKEVEVDDSDSVSNIKVGFQGIGISYINDLNEELIYATLRSVVLRYRVSDVYQTFSWQCRWFQIDNELTTETNFPVVAYPTVIPKDTDEMRQHPTFSGSITRVVDNAYGLTYIKHATMLLQEMTIEMDEDFLATVLDMFHKSKDAYQIFHSNEHKICEDTLEIPSAESITASNDIYFELLHLQPMQINVSFLRTGALSESNWFGGMPEAIGYIVDALTMALGNINDAPLKFNSLLIENVRTVPERLQHSIETHYSQELLYQVHKIVGSIDVIGSPLGLFNNISSGFLDLFYEPYLGYTMTDRPQDLGIGIAKGGVSFIKKSVFGFSDSISKVTGSLAKGMLSLTMDPSFQRRQRAMRVRDHPRHALYGVSMGATSFASSLASGISGLARAPIEGAATQGAEGFLKGFGKGLVGLPTKTAVGVLDFASNVTEGIRNTTTVFDNNTIGRARLPRVIPLDGVIRPYDERAAVGQMLLRTVDECSYQKDNYLAHTQVSPGKVLVVSFSRIVLINMNNMRREWQVTYDELKSVVMEHSGLSLKLHRGIQGPFIPLPERDSRRYIYENIGIAVAVFNQRKHVLF